MMYETTESARSDAATHLVRVARELDIARKLAAMAECDYRTTLGALRRGLRHVRSHALRVRIVHAAALLGVEVR